MSTLDTQQLVSPQKPQYKRIPFIVGSVFIVLLLIFGGLFGYYYMTTLGPQMLLANSLQKIYDGQYFTLELQQDNNDTPFFTIQTNKDPKHNRSFTINSQAFSKEYGMSLEAIATTDGSYIAINAPALHKEAKQLPNEHPWMEDTELYDVVLQILSKELWFYDDDRDDPLVHNLRYPSPTDPVETTDGKETTTDEKDEEEYDYFVFNGHEKTTLNGKPYTAFFYGFDKEKMLPHVQEWVSEAESREDADMRKRLAGLIGEAEGWDKNLMTLYVDTDKTMKYVDFALPQFDQEEIDSIRQDILEPIDFETDIEAQQFMKEAAITHVDGCIDIFTGEPNDQGLVSIGRATLSYSNDPIPLDIPSEDTIVDPEAMKEQFVDFMLTFQSYLQEHPSAIQQYDQLFTQEKE